MRQGRNQGDTGTRQERWKRGLRAETLAALYLVLKGYRLLGKRYKTRVGEIDLVMQKGQVLVFVEVKARTTHEEALQSIGTGQQQRIMRAAQAFAAEKALLSAGKEALAQRYDVVTFSDRGWWGLSWPRHIVDAWRE
ncbi:YraN family protein [Kiloniella sp. b19]|uniref:YraN family protein n=1 Tax=Kiloniella sp. GXU_MW_B19 TaxID=3141326 RepID=UPI0031CEF4B7